jgi:serine/threonine-protein kinase
MSFRIGDTVGTYKIVAALGSGGMGEVFQVEHAVTRRVEAMKVLAADTACAREQDQRFLREIQLQARLSHPHIAAVHNAFWQNGHLIMIMELIRGSSLRGVLERGRLPLASAIDYGCQALEALDYAHAAGVVHRDISPANMILTEDGALKLTDFGLAKSLNDIRLTQTGTLLGSLYYASPEQIRGTGDVDVRADIYSLGAVLFEMATGEKLFVSDNPFTLMLAHVEQPPRRASEVRGDLLPSLDEILLRALEKDPERRFQSAEMFRCALESLRENGDGPAGSAQTRPLLHPIAPARLSRRAAGAFAILHSRIAKTAATVLFAAALSYVWFSTRGAQPPDFAALPVTWPRRLMPHQQISYQVTPRRVTDSSRARRKGMSENPPQSDRKNHNIFMRAMGRVAHPLRQSSGNTSDKVRDPDTN